MQLRWIRFPDVKLGYWVRIEIGDRPEVCFARFDLFGGWEE